MIKDLEKTGFITKASAKYCDQFFLRAQIQLIPGVGGTLDTLLSGLGAKYQYERIEGFISELQDKFKKLEQVKSISSMEPSEELFDLIMQILDQIVKTRSEEKRKRFANLFVNQVGNQCDWDEAETACHLLGDISDIQIQILEVCLNAKPCNYPFAGERVLTIFDHHKFFERKDVALPVPTNITKYFPLLSESTIELFCSNLMAKGLLQDQGVGGYGGGIFMGYFSATDSAKWLIDWIAEPKMKSE